VALIGSLASRCGRVTCSAFCCFQLVHLAFCKLHANMHEPSHPSNALKTQLIHQGANQKG